MGENSNLDPFMLPSDTSCSRAKTQLDMDFGRFGAVIGPNLICSYYNTDCGSSHVRPLSLTILTVVAHLRGYLHNTNTTEDVVVHKLCQATYKFVMSLFMINSVWCFSLIPWS